MREKKKGGISTVSIEEATTFTVDALQKMNEGLLKAAH